MGRLWQGERVKTKEYYCAYALTILTMLWSAVVMVEALVYLIIKTIVVLCKDDPFPGRGIRNYLM